MSALAHVCDKLGEKLGFKNGSQNDMIYKTLISTALPLENVIYAYAWQRKISKDKKNHFVSVLTEKGLCFAFNSINSHEIYTDEYGIIL